MLELPTVNELPAKLSGEGIATLSDEVRALAAERDAVILAHNYQLPELQDAADFVGDSLGLSRQAAKSDAEVIEFCGVHFMAETASVLCPDKTVLIADLGAGCSLAESITADQVVEHILREHGPDTEILFGPDMWLGAFVERETGIKDDPEGRSRFHVW